MKNRFSFALAAFLIFVSLSNLCLAAEDISPASAPAPFTIILVNTKYYADVDVIKRNVTKLKYVQNFAQTVASQKHVQFTGTITADPNQFIEDVKSLSVERFEFQSRNDKDRGLVITLRKYSGS